VFFSATLSFELRKGLGTLLELIDVFVLTSLWEGLPIAVLEAMAASKPVVATRTGGIAEVVIEGKTGFLVPCRNGKQMLERLTLLLKDADLRTKLGRQAQDSLDFNFTTDNMIKRNEDLYRDLMEKKHLINVN